MPDRAPLTDHLRALATTLPWTTTESGRPLLPEADKFARLTPEQRDRLPSFVQGWIDDGWSTMPLSDDEWRAWQAGVQYCYEATGHRWPAVMVRVASPIVGMLAALVAARALEQLRRAGLRSSAAIDGALDSVLTSSVDPRHRAAVRDAASSAVRAALEAGGRDAHRSDEAEWVQLSLHPAVVEMIEAAVAKRVTRMLIREVATPVLLAVDQPIGDVVTRALVDQVAARWHQEPFKRPQSSYNWLAFAAFLRDEVNLPLDDELWRYTRACQDAHSTRWWWPTRDFVMVCDRPTLLHPGPIAGSDWLHNDTGPAIQWPDGWSIHLWHGTRVPADLVEPGWSTDRILAEPNAEIRRCAIERIGWDRFVADAGLKLRDQASDPANPGQWLRLYDMPRRLLPQRVRVLLCTNATRESDGTRHSFGLTVPIQCRTALAAAAWTFDLPESAYAALARAT